LLEGRPEQDFAVLHSSTIIQHDLRNLSIMHGLKGPNLAWVTACTTSAHCIGESGALSNTRLRCDGCRGRGGDDHAAHGGGFAAARALSTRNDDPHREPPWDGTATDSFWARGRSGGARGIRAREAAPREDLRELAGYGMSGDAYHMTRSGGRRRGGRCMENALRNAGLNRQDSTTSTPRNLEPLGDLAETVALKRCFGRSCKEARRQLDESMTGTCWAQPEEWSDFLGVGDSRPGRASDCELVQPGFGCDLDYVPTRPGHGRCARPVELFWVRRDNEH